MAILKVRDANGKVSEIPAIKGKSAYEYAKDGGYTGTEEEFAEKLANGTGGGLVGTELTQAEYDALSEEEKNSGLYFITDGVYEDANDDGNLLWNSDFRNPYRTSDATTFKSTGWSNYVYGLNKWYLNGVANSVVLTVNDNSITLSVSSETGHFRQPFGVALPNDTYTVSMNVLSVSGTVECYSSGSETYTLTTGKNVFQFTGPLTYLNIRGQAGSSVELEWVKLEQGSVATDGLNTPKLTAELILLMSIQQ